MHASSQEVLEEVTREVEEEAQQRLQQHNAKSQAARKGTGGGTPARRPGSSGQLPATPRTPAVAPTGAARCQQMVPLCLA